MKTAKGGDFLSLALLAFAGFAFELLLAYVIEPALGLSIDSLPTGTAIIHWLITSAVWFLIGWLLIRAAAKKYQFDIFETRCRLNTWQYLAMLLCIAIMIASHWLDWGGFKPYLEFLSNGPVKFIFLYIYYIFETFLFSLIIVFGQRAFELWFRKPQIPYGGIVLALTWGLGHLLSKGSLVTALLTAAGGFLFGFSYLIVGRDYRKMLPFLYILFVM